MIFGKGNSLEYSYSRRSKLDLFPIEFAAAAPMASTPINEKTTDRKEVQNFAGWHAFREEEVKEQCNLFAPHRHATVTGNVNKTVKVVTLLPDIRRGQLKFLSISCSSIFYFNIANAGLISFVQIKVEVMRPGPGGCLDLRVQRGKTLRGADRINYLN